MMLRKILSILLAALLCGSTVAMAEEETMMDKMSRQMLEVYMSKQGEPKTVNDPEDKYNFAGVKNVRLLSMMTGEESINQTETNYGVGGTDLGFAATIGDTTYFVFGDTSVYHDGGTLQKHNAVAWTTDDDYTDGITLDGWLMSDEEDSEYRFKEIIPTGVSGVLEVASIPGGAFALDDTLYVNYMSVKYWTGSSKWPSNFGSFAKSTDGGKTWNRVESLTWPGDSNFVQNCPVQVGDMVYVMGTGSARGNPMSLMRVPADQFEVFEAYEYLTGYSEDGSPIFEKGEEAMYGALQLQQDTGEMSIIWSEYLQEWLCMYKPFGIIQMCAAKELWGPWSEPIYVVHPDDMYAPYCPTMVPRYVSEDGTKIGFLVSQYWPIYNVGVAELELVRD